MRKLKKLSDDPKVKETLEKVKAKIESKKKDIGTQSASDFLYGSDITNLLTDLIRVSPLTAEKKKYLEALFIKRKTPTKAAQEAYGRDIGYYQADNIVKTLAKDKSVDMIKKEFLEIIKSIYVKFLPVASLKEFELILNPMTDDKVKLDAIKDIKATAGIGTEGQKPAELPVKISINIPTQTNIAIKNE